MIITFIGNDGSGKTTIAKDIYAIFKELGFDVLYKHEYDYVLLKYIFRLIGKNNLEKSRKEMLVEKKRSLLYSIWPILVLFDVYLQFIYFKIFKRKTIILLDRYIYDHYMSFKYLGYLNSFTEWLYLNFPGPDIGIMLWVEPDIAYKRKKDTHTYPIEFYIDQTRRYKSLSNIIGFSLINTNNTIENTIKNILVEIQRKSYIKKNNDILKGLMNYKVKNQKDQIDIISVIIPTYNRNDMLQKLLDSLIIETKNVEHSIEIIIVDDSENGVAKKIYYNYNEKFEKLVYTYSGGNRYPSVCRNIGARRSTGSILIFIDDDNVLSGKLIKNMCNTMMEHCCIGMLGVINYDNKGRLWSVGGKILKTPLTVILGNRKYLNVKEDNIILVDYLPNIYCIRREIFEDINGFDEKNFPHAMEEVDLALRVNRNGYSVCSIIDNSVYTVHMIDDTISTPLRPNRYYLRGRSRKMFYKKYFPNLLYWHMVPDIFMRSMKTLSYNISFSKKKELIEEYIRGCNEN